ncbi:MAG: glutamate decarboxylase [Clostridia bacterium]
MWTVVYIAKNNELAQKLREALYNHDIMVMLRAINKEQTTGYEILVPGAEVEEALGIIIDET